MKDHNRWTGAFAAGLVAAAGVAAFPTEGTYAVLTAKDYNADSLYADTLSGDAQTAVTQDPDYGKGFFGSSLTAFSKVNRWTLYRDGAPDAAATGFFPPNAACDYWVPGGDFPLATPNGGNEDASRYAFPGKSLTLASGTIIHCSKGTSVVDLGRDVRIVGAGNAYNFPARSVADPQTVGTLALSDGAGWTVFAGVSRGSRNVYGLGWTLTAPASATVTLKNGVAACAAWNWRGDGSKCHARLVLAEDKNAASEFALYAPYAGTVEVGRGNAAWGASQTATFGGLQLDAGGTLKLAAGTETVVGTLAVRAGGLLDATEADCGTVRVTDTLTADGAVRILLPSRVGFDRDTLTVPTSCALTAADFVCLDAADGAALDFATATFTDNGDGTKTLRVVDSTPMAPGLGATMVVRGTARVAQVDARVQIDVLEGATLDYAPATDDGARMPIRGAPGATVNIRDRQDEWSSLPLLWVDAAAAGTVTDLDVAYENSYINYEAADPLQTGQTICDGDGNPFVKGWADCRSAPCAVRLWNNRYDLPYNGNHNAMTACHPRRVRGGLNGRDYLSFDRPNRRFWAASAGAAAATERTPLSATLPRLHFTRVASGATAGVDDFDMKPRAAILVYGSQQGGGGALLGGNANFLRGGEAGKHTKDDPILASNPCGARVWVDGEAVDPTTTGLSGGWQIIVFDFGSQTNRFSGLGYGKMNAEDNGGQAYAEVMLFDRALTDAQRRQIEWHLATKWGLADQYRGPKGPTARAALYGSGTVRVKTDAVLSGAFSGTIELEGKTLTIGGALAPPDETAVDTTGMTGWYDPDAAGALVEADTAQTSTPKSPATRALWLYDRRCGTAPQAGFHALAATQRERAPWKDRSAHGFGPVRAWLDYSNVASNAWEGAINDGNTLRFRVAANGAWAGNVVTNTFRTLVMAQDSKYGGGQPFVDGNSVLPDQKQALYKKRERQGAASPIYPAGTADVLTKGVTRLDGEAVDGSAQGFRGRPEILAVQPTEAYGPVCFEHLGNSERLYGADTRAAVQGEILMWNRRLSEDELKMAEAYLSWKWLGLLPEGYVALDAATLAGTGTVRTPSLRRLPKIADAARLAVEAADAALVFTCDAGGIADACDLKASTLTLPDACEIALAQAARLKAGTYPLITCGAGLARTAFALTPRKVGSYVLSLARTDAALALMVRRGGTVFIFR